MTSIRHLEDQKRGYPTTVGALAQLVTRHGMSGVLDLSPDAFALVREELEADSTRANQAGDTRTAEIFGEKLAVLDGIESLTAGQFTLLRFKVRR